MGGSGPDGYFNGGVFGGGTDAGPQLYGGRFDVSLAAVWTLSNLGAGNRALVHQRIAQQTRPPSPLPTSRTGRPGGGWATPSAKRRRSKSRTP